MTTGPAREEQRSRRFAGHKSVRSWWPAVAASLVIHTGLVTWWTTRGARPRGDTKARRVQGSPSTPPATPDVALDVELIDVQIDVPAPPPAPPVARPAEPPGAVASRTAMTAPRAAERAAAPGAPHPGDPPASPPGPGEPARAADPHRWLTMRRGDAPRLALPAGRWDALDHPPAGTSPVRASASGLLDDAGGGRMRSDQDVFMARVERDGTMTLEDQPNLKVYLALPSPRALGRALAGWYESDKGAGDGGDTTMSRHLQVSGGATTEPPDPTTPRPKDRETTAIVPVIGGGFDVTDWLMRRHGGDPYSARKLAVLDATRDERVELGKRDRAAQLARVPQTVQRHLQALWASAGELAARKQALFEAWDDCAETGEPALVDAGAAARRMVIGFIRARLPAGSAGAYSEAEIAALARTQHSKSAFRPYD